jgi:hypothetical protein
VDGGNTWQLATHFCPDAPAGNLNVVHVVAAGVGVVGGDEGKLWQLGPR